MLDMDEVKSKLHGPAALVASTFRDDFSLNPATIERNVRFMAERGLGKRSGFLIAPCGDGEYVALSPEEHLDVVKAVVRGSDGAIPVVAGVATNDYRLAASLAANARPPGRSRSCARRRFTIRSTRTRSSIGTRASDARWISVSWCTIRRGAARLSTPCITTHCMSRLAEIRNVVAMKHSGLVRLIDEFTILDRYHERIAYIDSSAGYAATAAHMHGATGFISGIAPWWPEYELEYWDLLQAGKYLEAERHHGRLFPFVERFHHGSEPGANEAFSAITVMKAALEYVGLTGGPVRPPFKGLSQAEHDEVFRLLRAAGVPQPQLQSVGDA